MPVDGTARLFARTSVLYLVVSSLAGVYLFVKENYPVEYTSAHSHLLLIGWVTMGLVGALMASGDPPRALSLAGWALTNLGVLAMAGAWVASVTIMDIPYMKFIQAGAGALEFMGLLVVATAVWMAVRPAAEDYEA